MRILIELVPLPANFEKIRYDNIQYVDGTKEKNGSAATADVSEKSADFVEAPADVHELTDGEPFTKESSDEQDSKSAEKKRGVLRKLNLHK